jgi:hypothetical protein
MSAPVLLVVTPTLGRSEFLGRTAASVAALPLDTLHVLSAPADRRPFLQTRFPHARVVPDAGPAGGIYGALNAALRTVPDGWDWFTYINDDDALLPGLARMWARHLAGPEPAPVAYGDVETLDAAGQSIGRVTVAPDPSWVPALLQEGISPLMQQGTLFRRDLVRGLGGFDPRYRLCADLDFWLRAYAGGAGFRYYPIRVAQFRIRGGQLSGDTARTRREQAEIVATYLGAALPPWRRRWTRWRYRASNLPRYLARLRARGPVTSYRLLETGGGGR